MMAYQQVLLDKMRRVKRVFDVDKVTSVKPNLQSIAAYYRINRIPYSIFYKGNDFIHTGISRNGVYKKKDLLEQAKLVQKYIYKTSTKNVLELATGRGATSIYLANKYPKVNFYGIDLPYSQLDYGIKKSKKINNFHPSEGDYHDLTQFSSNMFDVVFVIEALCHSIRKEKVLKEVRRVLKKGGIFIMFDGYSKKFDRFLSKTEKLAMELTVKGMMVPHLDYYPEFKHKVIQEGFEVVYEEDVSLFILPSFQRMEKLAQKFFSLPWPLAKIITKIMPPEFTYNAISGYLGPTLIQLGNFGYEILAVKK